MTIEELKEHCVRQITAFEKFKEIMPVKSNDYKHYEEHKMVLQLIEALDKISEEIKNYDNFIICANGQKGIHIDKALEIIDKYLAEVENGNS